MKRILARIVLTMIPIVIGLVVFCGSVFVLAQKMPNDPNVIAVSSMLALLSMLVWVMYEEKKEKELIARKRAERIRKQQSKLERVQAHANDIGILQQQQIVKCKSDYMILRKVRQINEEVDSK